MTVFVAMLFAANAVAHVISYRQLAAKAAPNQGGVLLFAAVNVVLALLVGFDLSWAKWPALILPTLGGLGLSATTILPGKGTPIDFTILGLDITTIAVVLFGLIL